jgi:hypothetical protein
MLNSLSSTEACCTMHGREVMTRQHLSQNCDPVTVLMYELTGLCSFAVEDFFQNKLFVLQLQAPV